MKKLFAVLLIICLVTCMAGCLQENTEPKNEIAAMKLSQDQKEIVYLLSPAGEHEILFFDFETKQPYNSADFWVEIYENGELTDRIDGVNIVVDEAEPFKGKFTVLITQNQGWTFTLHTDHIVSGSMSDPIEMREDVYGRAYGVIDNPVEIENRKEIVLYTSIYSNDNIQFYGNQQIYSEQPELLQQYPYVHIIKCKFE